MKKRLKANVEGRGRGVKGDKEAKATGKRSSLDRQSTNGTAETRRWCLSPYGYLPLKCGEGSEVWAPRRCRHCEGCKRAHAARVKLRIKRGMAELGGRPGWLTLTSKSDVGTTWPQMMVWVKAFIRAIRVAQPAVEYAAVKHVGEQSGMLHVNLFMAPWRYVPRAELCALWRSITGTSWSVYVTEPKEGGAKASGYSVGYVLDKLPADLRKKVTYSRGFPKLPKLEAKWRVVGPVAYGLPTGYAKATNSGLLVVHDAGCGCVEEADEIGLDGHLFLQRIQERGPPEGG